VTVCASLVERIRPSVIASFDYTFRVAGCLGSNIFARWERRPVVRTPLFLLLVVEESGRQLAGGGHTSNNVAIWVSAIFPGAPAVTSS
jgi:hypothetical protein